MKVVFAGPSIAGLSPRHSDIRIRPPAAYGDVEVAVADGATVIGLIDGRFQQVASIWHKEILLALAQGVQVLGGASMGALRAAECEQFGMMPIGVIARRYASGELYDDGDVALLHGPAEMGYRAVTEPMVNVDATASQMVEAGAATLEEAQALMDFARSLHFTERFADTLFGAGSPVAALESQFRRHYVDQKTSDAAVVLDAVAALPDTRVAPPADWSLLRSRFWEARTH